MALPDASVDHEYVDGAHRFIVLRDGVVHQVDLEQNALSHMDADVLISMLEMVADRILADARPGVITIRGEVREELRVA
jgi:hypothetical protein